MTKAHIEFIIGLLLTLIWYFTTNILGSWLAEVSYKESCQSPWNIISVIFFIIVIAATSSDERKL
jgi:hypothetical protein